MQASIQAATAANASTPERAAIRPDTEEARRIAAEFEAVFVAEMLSHAGFEKALASEAGFGGEAMSGILLDAYAEKIVARGGFGLADAIASRLVGNGPENVD